VRRHCQDVVATQLESPCHLALTANVVPETVSIITSVAFKTETLNGIVHSTDQDPVAMDSAMPMTPAVESMESTNVQVEANAVRVLVVAQPATVVESMASTLAPREVNVVPVRAVTQRNFAVGLTVLTAAPLEANVVLVLAIPPQLDFAAELMGWTVAQLEVNAVLVLVIPQRRTFAVGSTASILAPVEVNAVLECANIQQGFVAVPLGRPVRTTRIAAGISVIHQLDNVVALTLTLSRCRRHIATPQFNVARIGFRAPTAFLVSAC